MVGSRVSLSRKSSRRVEERPVIGPPDRSPSELSLELSPACSEKGDIRGFLSSEDEDEDEDEEFNVR